MQAAGANVSCNYEPQRAIGDPEGNSLSPRVIWRPGGVGSTLDLDHPGSTLGSRQGCKGCTEQKDLLSRTQLALTPNTSDSHGHVDGLGLVLGLGAPLECCQGVMEQPASCNGHSLHHTYDITGELRAITREGVGAVAAVLRSRILHQQPHPQAAIGEPQGGSYPLRLLLPPAPGAAGLATAVTAVGAARARLHAAAWLQPHVAPCHPPAAPASQPLQR